jgi:tetratricopeptide (TPR) repeat protein
MLWSTWIWAGSAFAQETADDAAAREHFFRGRAAFEATEYEKALVHFRHAYRLSGRGQLQYNVGITASRLRRDEEALEAFEHYLEEIENPSREQEVRKRVAALRTAITRKEEQKQQALAEAEIRYKVADSVDSAPDRRDQSSGRRLPRSAIVGSSVLAAVGVAGVVTMGVGLARSGSCVERDTTGMCVSEHAATPWTGVYGALGIAALAGSATWLAVSSKRAKGERSTAWIFSPTGVTVSGSF